MPVERHIRYRLRPGQDTLTEGTLVGDPLVHLLTGKLRGPTQTHDPGDVLGSTSQAFLLSSPVDYGLGRKSVAHVYGADALRPVELGGREGQRRDRHLGDVDRNPTRRLHSVRVEGYATLQAQVGELARGLDCPDLVVRPDDGGKRRVGAQRRGELVRIDQSVAIDVDPRHLEAFPLQPLRVLPHRGVLHAGDYDVALLRGSRPG